MGDSTTTPAQGGANDMAALQDAINRLTQQVTNLTTAQADQQKTLKIVTDTMAADKEAAKTAAAATAVKEGDGKDKPVTLAAIEQLITERLGAQQQQTTAKAARDAYIGEKLKDLPLAYRNQLGNDAAKWADEEQTIRTQFQADMKTLGVTPKNAGQHTNPGGKPTAEQAVVDESKLSGMELLDKAVTETGAKPISAGEQNVTVVEAGAK